MVDPNGDSTISGIYTNRSKEVREVKEVPESGQFTVIWTYNDLIWSEVFYAKDDLIYVWDNDEDEFSEEPTSFLDDQRISNVKYFVYQ